MAQSSALRKAMVERLLFTNTTYFAIIFIAAPSSFIHIAALRAPAFLRYAYSTSYAATDAMLPLSPPVASMRYAAAGIAMLQESSADSAICRLMPDIHTCLRPLPCRADAAAMLMLLIEGYAYMLRYASAPPYVSAIRLALRRHCYYAMPLRVSHFRHDFRRRHMLFAVSAPDMPRCRRHDTTITITPLDTRFTPLRDIRDE